MLNTARDGNESGRAGLCLNMLGLVEKLRSKPWPFTYQRLYFKPDLTFLKARSDILACLKA